MSFHLLRSGIDGNARATRYVASLIFALDGLADEIEEALFSQLSETSYSEQLENDWYCLNYPPENLCSFKLLMGAIHPDSLATMTILKMQAPFPIVS